MEVRMPTLNTAIVTDQTRNVLQSAIAQVNSLVLGKQDAIEMVFTALLSGGHILIEDRPGLGKTTLARSMAATLGMKFQRMQFTADLLPSDILGVSIYEPSRSEFRFHPGPIFTQLLLADEINRAPPRTQSALLEAMAEHQVTVDGQCHALPQPFFVIATQNPTDLSGTYPLPDSQMDRFLKRISMGYPDPAAERAMLAGRDRRIMIDDSQILLSHEQIQALQKGTQYIHASEKLIAYVQALVEQSRHQQGIRVGLSPRAGLALLSCARARALLNNRTHVLPEDVQSIFIGVAAHRLVADIGAGNNASIAKSIMQAVAVD